MDNLEKLSALVAPMLNDPETMNSLKQAAEQMGLGSLLPDTAVSETKTEDNAADTDPSSGAHGPNASGLSADMLSAITRLAPLLSAPNEDDTTRLLSALRPFLSQRRAERLDEAERLLSITRLLSILKESKLI